MRTVAVLLAAAGVLVLASCGGDNGSSGSSSTGDSSSTVTTGGPTRTITKTEERKIRRARAKTIAKVNQACRRANGSIAPVTLSIKDDPREVQRTARRLRREYKRAAAELASVNARASQSRQDVGSGVLRATKALKDAGQVLGQIEGAAQGGDLSTVGPEIGRLKSDINRYQKTVRRFGFKDCY